MRQWSLNFQLLSNTTWKELCLLEGRNRASGTCYGITSSQLPICPSLLMPSTKGMSKGRKWKPCAILSHENTFFVLSRRRASLFILRHCHLLFSSKWSFCRWESREFYDRLQGIPCCSCAAVQTPDASALGKGEKGQQPAVHHKKIVTKELGIHPGNLDRTNFWNTFVMGIVRNGTGGSKIPH